MHWIAVLVVVCLSGRVCGQATWCGRAECPPQPRCEAIDADLMMVLDHSGSMQDNFIPRPCPGCWPDIQRFAVSVMQQAKTLFRTVRAGAVTFGGETAVTRFDIDGERSSSPDELQSALARVEGPRGGTPTDSGIFLGRQQLEGVRKPQGGVQRLMVLCSDGVPTRCATCEGDDCPRCIGSDQDPAVVARARPFAIRQSQLTQDAGILMLSIGVTIDGHAQAEAGFEIMSAMASEPREVFGIPDISNFTQLLQETLPRIVDLFCAYSIALDANCKSPNERVIITGHNFLNLGQGQPLCSFTANNRTEKTNAVITVNGTGCERIAPGCGSAACRVPSSFAPGTDVVVEVSRDGDIFTGNELVLRIRDDCTGERTNFPTPIAPTGISPIAPTGISAAFITQPANIFGMAFAILLVLVC